jgi:hypothetical protein
MNTQKIVILAQDLHKINTLKLASPKAKQEQKNTVMNLASDIKAELDKLD